MTAPHRIHGTLDAIMHLASPAAPGDYLRMPLATLRAGSIGTLNMAETARQKNATLLLASTSEIYGDPMEHPQPESYLGNVNPVGPRSVYDETKRFAEAVIAQAGREGVATAIARIFNTYGPRMSGTDSRAVPTFLRQACAGKPLTVAGNGTQTRSLCYVDDTVDALIKLLTSGADRRPPSSSSACHKTIRAVADPTLAARRECWAGGLRSICEKACPGPWSGSAATRPRRGAGEPGPAAAGSWPPATRRGCCQKVAVPVIRQAGKEARRYGRRANRGDDG